MLDIGNGKFTSTEKPEKPLTEDESIVAFSMRAFFGSPIQISSKLDGKVSDFELAVYCNEEVLSIHQDCGFCTAIPVLRKEKEGTLADVMKKELQDGSCAYAFFNLGETTEQFLVSFAEPGYVLDVWAREDLFHDGKLFLQIAPHTVQIIRCEQKPIAISADC